MSAAEVRPEGHSKDGVFFVMLWGEEAGRPMRRLFDNPGRSAHSLARC